MSKKNVVLHVCCTPTRVINCAVSRLQPHIDITKLAAYSASVVKSIFEGWVRP